LYEKPDPDKSSQNSIKSRSGFFTCQPCSVFVPFIAPWDPILGLCGKSRIMTGACEMRWKFAQVFLPVRQFLFSFLWSSLGIPSWSLAGKRVIMTGARKFQLKVIQVFLLVWHFPFSFLWISLGIPSWILLGKAALCWDPIRTYNGSCVTALAAGSMCSTCSFAHPCSNATCASPPLLHM